MHKNIKLSDRCEIEHSIFEKINFFIKSSECTKEISILR